MALQSTVLFGSPQTEIANLLNFRLANARTIKIVTGFATVEGVKVLEQALVSNPRSLETLVIGAGTYKAYEALDQLIRAGIPGTNLFVHLGHTRNTGAKARHSFYRYHPMLHSKIYYTENGDGTACAIIGSHNITGFALKGLNGEASVMIEGDINDPEFEKVRQHIEAARNEATLYQPDMKEAYAWWANQFMEGLAQKSNDLPKEIEKKPTILIFSEAAGLQPKQKDILYLELPAALGKIQSTRAEVHLFVFDKIPRSPQDCLASLHTAKASFWCTIEGVENDEGGKELKADWFIADYFSPRLQRAGTPFRPTPASGMQQIRIRLKNAVFGSFDYLFGKLSKSWFPILNEQEQLTYEESYAAVVEKLDLIPSETKEWYLVSGLSSEKPTEQNQLQLTNYDLVLKELAPESGGFVLFSTARKELKRKLD